MNSSEIFDAPTVDPSYRPVPRVERQDLLSKVALAEFPEFPSVTGTPPDYAVGAPLLPNLSVGEFLYFDGQSWSRCALHEANFVWNGSKAVPVFPPKTEGERWGDYVAVKVPADPVDPVNPAPECCYSCAQPMTGYKTNWKGHSICAECFSGFTGAGIERPEWPKDDDSITLEPASKTVAGVGVMQRSTGPNEDAIREVCQEVCELLLRKNRGYGDSAFKPVRVFSKLDALAGINVRIDDKLSRIARGTVDNEDTELDLIGYLILKRIAVRNLNK